MQVMKFKGVGSEQELAELVASDDWVVEQKMDGTRTLINLTAEGIDWNGLAHSAATQWFPRIEQALSLFKLSGDDSIWLDGEIMIHTGEYRVFDAPYVKVGGRIWNRMDASFAERRRTLEAMAIFFAEPVAMVEQARGFIDKVDLIQRVREAGGEGVVLKNLDGTYQPGWRVTTQLKYQFTKRADLVVMERKPNSATLGVYRDGELVQVGACSMIGKPDAQPGDVIELMYLYWTGSSLYQPRMVRIREDKAAFDCTFEQFEAYSREVV